MDAGTVLYTFRLRGFTVARDGDKLLVRPRGLLTDEDRQQIRQYKAALLLTVGWNILAALREFQKAGAVIRAALSQPWLSAAQRNVLAVFRRQVSEYHDRHDPLLYGSPAWIEAHVARWRAEYDPRRRR